MTVKSVIMKGTMVQKQVVAVVVVVVAVIAAVAVVVDTFI